MEELLTPAEAARIAGVSYPTLKQWIYQGKIRSTKTAGGHHRIARSEIERVTGAQRKRSKTEKPVGLDAISGRNKLAGILAEGISIGTPEQNDRALAAMRDLVQ